VLQVGATRDLLDGAAGVELRAYLGEFQIAKAVVSINPHRVAAS
jgi:hypothetical protein